MLRSKHNEDAIIGVIMLMVVLLIFLSWGIFHEINLKNKEICILIQEIKQTKELKEEISILNSMLDSCNGERNDNFQIPTKN